MKPVLIKIGDKHLINPNQIICINLERKTIFLSGTRYSAVSDEDLAKVLEYCTVIDDAEETSKISEIPPL